MARRCPCIIYRNSTFSRIVIDYFLCDKCIHHTQHQDEEEIGREWRGECGEEWRRMRGRMGGEWWGDEREDWGE